MSLGLLRAPGVAYPLNLPTNQPSCSSLWVQHCVHIPPHSGACTSDVHHHHIMVRHGGACVCAMVAHGGGIVVSWWCHKGSDHHDAEKNLPARPGRNRRGRGGAKGPIDGTTDRIGIPHLSGTNPDRCFPKFRKLQSSVNPLKCQAPRGAVREDEQSPRAGAGRIGSRIKIPRKRESPNGAQGNSEIPKFRKPGLYLRPSPKRRRPERKGVKRCESGDFGPTIVQTS